jgi:hypothetical protein
VGCFVHQVLGSETTTFHRTPGRTDAVSYRAEHGLFTGIPMGDFSSEVHDLSHRAFGHVASPFQLWLLEPPGDIHRSIRFYNE